MSAAYVVNVSIIFHYSWCASRAVSHLGRCETCSDVCYTDAYMSNTAPYILIFSQHSVPLARRVAAVFEEAVKILAPAKVFPVTPSEEGVELYEEAASQKVSTLFRNGHPLVAMASVGLMVRLIAGSIRGKEIDPPVVVVDEAGRYVVPILSGHLGGGNALAERIAAHLDAVPVVTTATESVGTLPIDRIAGEEGWRIDDLQALKAVARCLVNGEPVVVVQECGGTAWQQRFEPMPASIDRFSRWEDIEAHANEMPYATALTPRPDPLPTGARDYEAGPPLAGEKGQGQPQSARYRAGVLISDRCIPDEALQAVAPAWVVCRPPSLVVGVGAEKGVAAEVLDAAVHDVLKAHGLAAGSVAIVATLDRKADEEGFQTWLGQRGWPVVAYTAEQLAQVHAIPNPSHVVAQAIGAPGVCEPAALLASGNGALMVPKQKHGRVTVAVARLSDPFSPGERVREDTGAEQEPLPQPSPGGRGSHNHGRLAIVGIGPGAPDLLTVRAINALDRAEVVVGYERYIQLLGDRVAGKDIRGSAIGREVDRAQLAIDLARQGHDVALISSGDAGIYGMGGLVFEQLESQGWTPGQPPEVDVIPGVSAAQSAASLLGAPLSNDFAVLSLSDLLTPRETIERRLEALAAADLVMALYNPQSQKRRALFQQACETLLRHRPATTPVAVVRSAYRDSQAIHLTELGQLQRTPVDMESLVLIGNSQTRRFADRLVTARGYMPSTEADSSPQLGPHARRHNEQDDAQSPRKILFVGAGPGDPELLTLRAAQALGEADVVVYAGSLVPRGVLRHVKPGARVHNSATMTLEETHRLLTEAYRAGHQVVRLHSGDPSLYGAITEQMALLDAEDIPYEIVPGVSAFQAVAARLGIEYTQPGVVQTVILTRAGGRTGLPANESLAELARHQVTLCLFLSARHVAEVQAALLTSYPPTTPVAVAYRATWPDEELLTGSLEELTTLVQREGYERTTLIIVGPSLRRHGGRSRLYDATHWHLFRPEKVRRRATAGIPEAPALATPDPNPLPQSEEDPGGAGADRRPISGAVNPSERNQEP
jgi:cobalt-precorrin 5A hydrolase/precorrin-3B C17-methyltransferase